VRFAFSDDQLLFRDTVRDFLDKECPPEVVRAAWDAASPQSDLWRGLAEMGVIGGMLDEAHGGLGMHELDLVLLLEETGRAAMPGPVVESAVVGGPLLQAVGADHADVQRILPRLADGEATVAVAFGNGRGSGVGRAGLVLDADVAEYAVFERDGRIVMVPRDKLTLERQPSVDGARRLFAVDHDRADEVELASGEAARLALATAVDRGALGTAAQLLGLADRLLVTTVEYVKAREQFGVPIGSFQAIKHHLADALLALEFARPVVYRAAYSMAGHADTASRDASMAKCYASDAASLVARKALQCHGAIGYTVEYDLHLWMKRVWALSAAWGDASHHRALVADSVLGPRP